MVKHPKTPLCHSACRDKKCLICFSRADRSLKTNLGLQKSIEDYFKISLSSGNFDLNEGHVPTGICDPCRLKLGRGASLELCHTNFLFIGEFSLGTDCECLICQQSKSKANILKKSRKQIKKGKSLSSSERCNRCMSIIRPGRSHNCTPATLANNLCNIVNSSENVTAKVGEVVASSVIKRTSTSTDGTIKLKQAAAGRRLPVRLAATTPSPKKQFKVSALALLKFQVENNLGDGAIRNVATFFNRVFGRGTVEPGFQQKLSQYYKFFDSHFVTTTHSFSSNGHTPTFSKKPLVHVKSLSDFVLQVLSEYNLHPHDFDIKLGIDKGQGFLKFTVTFVPKVNVGDNEESFAFNKQGVNDIFVVASCHGVEETHYNLAIICNMIGLWDVQFVYSGDLKVINMLAGIQTHACKHPIYACTQDNEHLGEICDAPTRTLGSLVADYYAYQSSSKKPEDAQACNNVTKWPLFTSNDQHPIESSLQSIPLLHLIPPPQLHLKLGPFKNFFDALLSVFPEAVEWPQSIFKTQQAYHGGEFVGNDVSALLENCDVLQTLSEKYGNLKGPLFVRIFRAFRDVVNSCFGSSLQEDYKDKISEFRCAVLDAGIKVTPKMHIIFFHVSEWCDFFKVGLGRMSEQTLESSHNRFKKYFARFKVSPMNPRFGDQLRSAMVSFNSKAFYHQLQKK